MIVSIKDLASHVGQTVTLQGWIYARTDKGKLVFLQVRDGTGICQAVVFKRDVDEATFDAALHISQESSVTLTGEVRADPRAPGVPGGFEVGVKTFSVVQKAQEYPITPKEHGVEFLLDNRHLWIRSSRQW
ncbi:MAG TPA: OB-fold nucleic acid binding domain-containing protein, partial [Thermoflexales bacterium]|nr:OB-fold nucleic acid binding domain-containing protein [Thermoflexales bacterium]